MVIMTGSVCPENVSIWCQLDRDAAAKKVEVVDQFVELLALDGYKDVSIGNSLNR